MKKKDFEYLKDQVKEYLHFSSSERNGLLILLLLIVFFIFLPRIYLTFYHPNKSWDPSQFINEIELSKNEVAPSTELVTVQDIPCNAFDPNKASEESLLETGLPAKVVKTILNYRNKGGAFKTPSDLKKIYGLKEQEFLRIESCIKITGSPKKGKEKNYKTLEKKEYKKSEYSEENRKDKAEIHNRDSGNVEIKKKEQKAYEYKPVEVEINQATEEEWQDLYGIGPVLSARIVKFRESLGGFISISQVSEVFGLPDSTFLKIQANLVMLDPMIRKIRINEVNAEELKSHPYFTWKQANVVIKYRENHGPFKGPEDLSRLHIIKNSDLNKIIPYLEFKE